MQITFQETPLHLIEDTRHEFLLSNKEVALGYGTTIQSLNQAKRNNETELIEGKHWLKLEVQTKGGKQKVIHWTKKGIVRLGFFIKSENAKKFRDWAEDYIVNTVPGQNDELKKLQDIIMAQNKLIAEQPIKQKPDDIFMNDPVLHNNFLEFLYQANRATHEVNIIRHLSPALDTTHQSLSNFLLHITRRYEKIRGVDKHIFKQII